MKVSDLMLDLATGDASIHDVYIQEAVGKINVSNAIFNAAYKVSELPDGEFGIIQEAADAGLPTDPNGAANCASEAVTQEMTALYTLIIESAKKINAAAKKELKGIIAFAKKDRGITFDTNADFEKSFAVPLARAVGGTGKISIDDKRFLKAKYSEKIIDAYGTGVMTLLAAYGVSFTIPTLNSKYAIGKRANITSLNDISKNISDGTKLVDFDKVVNEEKHYTDKISEDDIKEMLCALHEAIALSNAIIDASKGLRKDAVLNIFKTFCNNEDCGSKKVSKTLENLNDDLRECASKLNSITDIITKVFGDSTTTLIESLGATK